MANGNGSALHWFATSTPAQESEDEKYMLRQVPEDERKLQHRQGARAAGLMRGPSGGGAFRRKHSRRK